MLSQVNLAFLVIALFKVFKSARGTVKRKRTLTGKKKESESMDMTEKKILFTYVQLYSSACNTV